MAGTLLRRFGVLAIALVALAGVGTASAQQAPGVVGTIYNNYNGQAVGQAQVVISGGQMQVAISVTSLSANSTYAVCATDPHTAQTFGCQSAVSSFIVVNTIFSTCAFVQLPLPFSCFNTAANPVVATLSTTPGGAGAAHFTLPATMPVLVIQLTNIANIGDSAQAVIQTGASSNGCSSNSMVIIGGC
jgi:hypothetical protein